MPRPDLLDFESLKKCNAHYNLQNAFNLAEKELGLTKLLDPEGRARLQGWGPAGERLTGLPGRARERTLGEQLTAGGCQAGPKRGPRGSDCQGLPGRTRERTPGERLTARFCQGGPERGPRGSSCGGLSSQGSSEGEGGKEMVQSEIVARAYRLANALKVLTVLESTSRKAWGRWRLPAGVPFCLTQRSFP